MIHQLYRMFTWAILLTLILQAMAMTVHGAAAGDTTSPPAADHVIVIGSNCGGVGALGNSLPGIVRAHALGLDYLDLPLVLTADSELVVHDSPYLENASNAGEIFPQRVDRDGRLLVSELTLSELRQLRIWSEAGPAISAPAFPIPTFKEALTLLRYLDAGSERKTGIAPRLVSPGFYRNKGQDPAMLTLMTLKEFGYPGELAPAILMSSDGDELQRLTKQVMPELGISLPLVQLIEQKTRSSTTAPKPYDHSWIFTRMGLRVVHSYASFLAVHTAYFNGTDGHSLPETFLDDLRALNLKILVFPIADYPQNIANTNLPNELEHFLGKLNLDGLLTHNSAQVLQQLKERSARQLKQPTAANPLRNINLQPLTLEEKQGSPIILNNSGKPIQP